MDAPVRMVCSGCLRSVEVDDSGSAGDTRCPHCGEPIASKDVDPGARMTQVVRERLKVEPSRLESIPGWEQTWSQGSLGSLGRFQLRERLGDGGFGHVYLAYDPRLDRDVALKVLKQRNPSDRVMERFFREARAAARLDHPNIVAVHDAGFDDGRCWVAFHFISGRPLDWYHDHHQLDPATSAKILRDLADAVDHAHRQGVLHRDLKPANIVIDDLGRPRLIDFGLARRSDLDSSLTHDGAVVGTPAYMSPEQALGFSSRVDERSDVFSLGVIFFEMLCGQRPNTASPVRELETDKRSRSRPSRSSQVPSARSIRPAVPAALDRICGRAIARDPRSRYPSARALAEELDGWLLRHKGGGPRLSFAVSMTILGVAAALFLVIDLQLARVPWGGKAGWPVSSERTSSPAEPAPSASLVGTMPGSSPPTEASEQPRMIPSVSKDPPFVGNLRKKIYHRADCPTVKEMNRANRTDLEGPEQAAAMGLQPCGICDPPSARDGVGARDGP